MCRLLVEDWLLLANYKQAKWVSVPEEAKKGRWWQLKDTEGQETREDGQGANCACRVLLLLWIRTLEFCYI